MDYRPIKKNTLEKWLNSGAFLELLDTGDENLLNVLTVYKEHGIDTAWLFYSAMLFVEDNDILLACGEATALYQEALIDRCGYNIDIDYTPVVDFLNRLRQWHYCNDTLRHLYSHASTKWKARKNRIRWPVNPHPAHVGELIVLANFLMYIITEKNNYEHRQSLPERGNTEYIAIYHTIKVFHEDIRPWFETLEDTKS